MNVQSQPEHRRDPRLEVLLHTINELSALPEAAEPPCPSADVEQDVPSSRGKLQQ